MSQLQEASPRAGASGATGATPSAGFYEYQIANSILGSAAGDTTLKWTAGTPSSTDIMTMSFWVKRHTPDSTDAGANNVFTTGTGGGNYFYIAYNATLTMENTGGNQGTGYLLTEEKYRDPAAWYHVILRIDTSQSTQFDRIRVYVNGQQLGVDEAWRNQVMITNTAQNEDFSYLNADGLVQAWGGLSGKGHGTEGADLSIADVMFFDGQSYYAELGETKNGVWIPKDPSGLTFGNNGYWLKFTNSSNLGEDFSGNDNDFTVANFSSHDQLTDTPTNNFCRLNPLSNVNSGTLSEGNLKATASAWTAVYGTFEVPVTGSWYWEYISENHVYAYPGVQTITTDANQQNHDFVAVQTGEYRYEGTGEANTSSIGTGDIVAFWVNDGVIKVYVNNSLDHTFGTNMASSVHAGKTFFPSTIGSSAGIFNFGQDGTFAGAKTAGGNADANGHGNFMYTPKGLALCTANMSIAAAIDPAETDDNYPQKLFQAKTYTGTLTGAGVANINHDLGSAPDFIWSKTRNANGTNHMLRDSTRGANKTLSSNTNGTEADKSGNGDMGSTFATSTTFPTNNTDSLNTNTNTFIAWLWRANGGTTSSNSTGSITSTVQADPSGCFSIVTYTGESATRTVGHGLSAAPYMMIIKSRGGSRNWGIYHKDMGLNMLTLNSTGGQDTGASTVWGGSHPTSSVFSVGDASESGKSEAYVAYCFANCEGYIKAGSYNGNDESSDGTFVYTGFKPAFVMGKGLVSGAAWWIQDNATSPFNESSGVLEPNSSDDTYTSANPNLDFLSNGFKVRNNNSMFNSTSYDPFVFLAIAENPLKYATAR